MLHDQNLPQWLLAHRFSLSERPRVRQKVAGKVPVTSLSFPSRARWKEWGTQTPASGVLEIHYESMTRSHNALGLSFLISKNERKCQCRTARIFISHY